MTTNATIIKDALRLLGVVGETGSVTSEQGEHALRKLNQMLEAWTEEGIELGWFEQSLTTDTAPLPKWAEKGVTSKLAQDLQAVYPSSQLQPWVFDDSRNGYGVLLRNAMNEALKPANMDHMARGTGRYGSGWDIESGS